MLKSAVLIVASNLVSILCVLAAFYLVLHHVEQWMWFLIVAMVCRVSGYLGEGSRKSKGDPDDGE